LRALRGTDRALVGCYHSHPNGRPGPSPRDRTTVCETGFAWVIIATGVSAGIAAFQSPGFDPMTITIQG
jgi:proteasome lid subunit RPN8/RPN11